jgi:hypothetical protein
MQVNGFMARFITGYGCQISVQALSPSDHIVILAFPFSSASSANWLRNNLNELSKAEEEDRPYEIEMEE